MWPFYCIELCWGGPQMGYSLMNVIRPTVWMSSMLLQMCASEIEATQNAVHCVSSKADLISLVGLLDDHATSSTWASIAITRVWMSTHYRACSVPWRNPVITISPVFWYQGHLQAYVSSSEQKTAWISNPSCSVGRSSFSIIFLLQAVLYRLSQHYQTCKSNSGTIKPKICHWGKCHDNGEIMLRRQKKVVFHPS